MAGHSVRERVLNLHRAFYSGDIDGAMASFSDDAEFFVHAPIDLFPHLGLRRGKSEIEQMYRTIHTRYSGMRHEIVSLLAENDKAAAHVRVFFRKSYNNRIVQFDFADFYSMRDGLICNIVQIMDSYDLVQQVLERDATSDVTFGENPQI